jgi:hypothetical protein
MHQELNKLENSVNYPHKNGHPMKRVFFALAFFLISVLVVPSSFAQELASLTGVVTDNTGAVIPAAAVTLTDTKTNASYKATTNSLGAYTFAKVLPGPGYKLEFSKEGFENLTISGVYVGVGAANTQNAQMQVGAVTETIEVSGQDQPVSLNTTDATVGTNFDLNMIHELPIENRGSPAALLQLQPGVASNSVNDTVGSRDGAITGARVDQNNITLDGLDVNDFATGQAFATVGNAPVDSIQEFRGETANPLAASGRGSGAQIQLVTKNGTNNWHGSLFEYHRNTITEANDLFNSLQKLPTPKLIRNFFGGTIGGPIVKDKLFFFFNYQGRRDAREDSVLAVVPLDSFRDGNVQYIKGISGCDGFSRQNTQPTCIGSIPNTGPGTTITSKDPQGVGSDTALLDYINGRYPHANDPTRGDGVNTGGFRFNAPAHRTQNDFVGRVDYNLSNSMKLFGRFSILRDTSDDDQNFAAAFEFPGDPVTHTIVDHSFAYVIGHTWNLSPTKVNNFFYGETRSVLDFPTLFNPTKTLSWTLGSLAGPYSSLEAQKRTVPIPVFRDDFTYIRGKHNFQMGGTFKPIRTTQLQINDFEFPIVGIGGNLQSLDSSLRPSDILSDTTIDPSQSAIDGWDSAFTLMLGRFQGVNSNFEHSASLQPLAHGTGHTRNYRYYETEVYFQDTWRLRHDLTMTYGLRYQYYSVPYETNGFEALPDIGPAEYFNERTALAAAGSFNPVPLLSYNLGGKANHARGMYNSDWKDFAPRLAFAYNPGVEHGFLSKLLGNRKTVIRAGGGIIFDHTAASSINFIQDQNSYIFQSKVSTVYPLSGFGTPAGDALLADPRFTAINAVPVNNVAPTITVPFQPFVDSSGVPFGTSEFDANFAVDPKLKTPYSIAFSFGLQRELPGNFLVEANYVGRLGRRLLARADAGQFVDFPDPFTPGHSYAKDFFDLSKQLRAGVDPNVQPVNPEPFFDDFFFPGATQVVAQLFTPLILRGDLTDTAQQLTTALPDLGIASQFGSNIYYTNKAYSSYNGLLMTLHKRESHGLQFDLNYTFSHSIDNSSAPANTSPFASGTFNFSGALICDISNLRQCRGNSDFDLTHVISGNFIYELPFGRGKSFGANLPRWADHVVGGWQISGIPSWHTGFAFTTVSNAFPVSFEYNTPAIFVGKPSDIKTKIHFEPGTGFQLFADQAKAIAAFRGPLGLEGGNRNNFRGPSYTNLDLGVAKHFRIGEKFIAEFRADAYNVFNHVNFGLPGTGGSGGTADFTDPSSFGVLNTDGNARQMQFALRLEF